jgi:hypothetical protein
MVELSDEFQLEPSASNGLAPDIHDAAAVACEEQLAR